jgi:hypothetical protein
MKNMNYKKIFLGRRIVGVVICVLLVATSMTAITATSNLKGDIKQRLNLNKQVISPDSLSYSFYFKEPSFESIQAGGSEYTKINMPGCLAIGQQAGEPNMPLKIVKLLLPPKKAVSSIDVVGTPVSIDLSGIDLTKKPVFPYQKPVPIGNDKPQEFIINKNVYSSATPYPSAIYTDYHIGYSHGYAILDLGLNPMQYTPKAGTLVYYQEMTIFINLKDTNYVNQFFSNNPSDEAYVKSLVSNPDFTQLYQTADLPTFEYPGGLCDPSQNFDYVIVTTTQNGLDHWDIGGTLTYNWDSLMAKHAGDGLTSTLVTVQDIDSCTDYQNSDSLFNDQQAHVREFCKDAYEDWGTRYILFAGDAEYIYPRLMDSNGEYGVDADLYWSNLDNNFNGDHDSQWGEEYDSGFDLYAELYIGRIPCDVPQDVSNWLTKSFYYADSSDPDYLDNAAFYGGDTGWDCQGDDFMDYSAIKGTSTWLGPDPNNPGPFPTWVGFQFGFETWNEVNPENQYNLSNKWTQAPSPNPGWRGNGIVGLRNAINNDLVTIISAIAHANNQMSLDVDVSQWQSQYHNTKPFLIHDYGCHCGDFDDGDGILDLMLFDSNIKLSFGCIYNTGYGWGQYESTNSSSAFQAKEFWGYFLDVENHSGDLSNWQLGKAQAWSKDQMAPMMDWGNYDGTWREIIQSCLLFADPAQQLKTPHPSEPPETPDAPDGPDQWIRNIECTFSSVTTDPEGDNISYIFDWGDGTLSSWLGPYQSGQTVEEEHAWTELGDYEVKIRAKDIWGVTSDWSEASVISIVEDQAPIKPAITGKQRIVGGLNYNYTFVSTDPEGDDIYYKIDWDDGHVTDWLGPYSTGESIALGHKWLQKGDYTIKAWAKDIYEKMSGQSNYMVKVLFVINSNPSNNQMMLNILQSLQQKATNS